MVVVWRLGWRWWIPWRWIPMLAVLSSLWVNGAPGQHQGQIGAPAATESSDSEISTRVTDTAIKVQVNLHRGACSRISPGTRRRCANAGGNHAKSARALCSSGHVAISAGYILLSNNSLLDIPVSSPKTLVATSGTHGLSKVGGTSSHFSAVASTAIHHFSTEK
jgi:hypothetical protein